MKKILGLDLGTSSIGWAIVNEAENNDEKSSIVKLGVRVNPLTVDEQRNFELGKRITTNADRTLKRGARRNLQRYKLRRENLKEVLLSNGIVADESILLETGNATTFETYRLRAKSATEQVTLDEFARVLLMINKKRGYKSSRKVNSSEEGKLIDGMSVAKQLYDENLTPGQFAYSILKSGKTYIPDFYRSDLLAEFERIWNFQKQFYPEIFTEALRENLCNKNEKQTWAICQIPFALVGIKRETKGDALKKENYAWRVKALHTKMELEELAVVLQKINGQLKNTSGYLGDISDRSKTLYFNKQTVGQYQMSELDKDPHHSLKNEVFYRQDYLDEFERIWETQAQYYELLTPALKREIRDIVIFYQRALKSQKGLISICELENRKIEIEKAGKKVEKIIGPKVAPKSSPIFQEFKIWQVLNNITVCEKDKRSSARFLTQEEKETLYAELSLKDRMMKSDALKLLFANPKDLDLNFKSIEGNRTQATLFNVYKEIIEMSGHGEYDFSKLPASQVMEIVKEVFGGLGCKVDFLTLNTSLATEDVIEQPMYKLWHLIYSYAGDNSNIGNDSLITKISELCGFERSYASLLANVVFASDYGSLSAKAIMKLLPHLKEGVEYSEACVYAGYNHSKRSLATPELEQKSYADRLQLLPRNSLRNPVVEKILNQMINVVNSAVDAYGKPDEIRIELARELKKNAAERADLTAAISKSTAEHEKYREELRQRFGILNVSRNDIIRYKLYLELKENGFKTLYSNTYIPQEKLFSKEFDIEHIIPQSKLFDDSFSNKTLESRAANIEKGNATALDYVATKYGIESLNSYKERIDNLYKKGIISRTKRDKLLMPESEIPSDFINRDLRDSQYIAKKAREILESMVKFVVPTTGAITDRLREDWQLVHVMRELNWEKYDKLGLTDVKEDKDGRMIRYIKDWTKRNDHRHHAMDALTIAFTKRSYIQYLNNLNARSDKSSHIFAIEQKELERDSAGRLRFKSPIPLGEFRAEALSMLAQILVSIKAKSKVVTKNVNVTKKRVGSNKKVQLTPRGQLHNETIYGKISCYATKFEKVGSAFNEAMIAKVANQRYRNALLARLAEYNNDPKKAFTGKNSLENNPIYVDALQTHPVPSRVKTVFAEDVYTIRKPISPDLKIEKVIDANTRRVLQKRLDEYGGDARKAFSNLDECPIWLNKPNGIAIKRVKITGVSNATALHDKRDHKGNLIYDVDGRKIAADYVSTSNNHHVAIYRDAAGNLQENVISFYEATTRANLGLPIVDKSYRQYDGWEFLFTMKQNEYFVFPNEQTGFNPAEIDLLNPVNYSVISPNLFRVQKIAIKDYFFRHHLETTVMDDNRLKGITWIRTGPSGINGIVKVRVNHIGQIVSIGEY